jgi:hypothetical protein
VYWDQARVGRRAAIPGEPARLEAQRADLRERGFSAETSPDGREPWGYDYARVSTESPWKAFPGRDTRTGDVRELLAAVDDVFVISRPGDDWPSTPPRFRCPRLEADVPPAFRQPARDGPPPATPVPGSAPFHGMTRYPYAADIR